MITEQAVALVLGIPATSATAGGPDVLRGWRRERIVAAASLLDQILDPPHENGPSFHTLHAWVWQANPNGTFGSVPDWRAGAW